MKTLWARLGLVLAVLTLFAAGATPTEAASRRYTQIAAGGQHACAITAQGKAYCWGSNEFGQLGNDDATHTRSTTAVAVAEGYRFKSIASSTDTTCGLTSSGQAYCWGANNDGSLGFFSYSGALGIGDVGITHSDAPRAVVGSLRFKFVSAGTGFFCGLTTGSKLFCWGSNFGGQLGDGTQIDRAAPVEVSGNLKYESVTTENWGTCAVGKPYAVYCWGYRVERLTPWKFESESRIVRLEATEGPACGLTRGGSLLCFDNNTTFRKIAGAPKYTNLAIGSGEVYTLCGIKKNGSVSCWDDEDAANPVKLNSSRKFQSLTQGGTYMSSDQFTCGLTRNGVAYCWGENEQGQLGNGTLDYSSDPVAVQ